MGETAVGALRSTAGWRWSSRSWCGRCGCWRRPAGVPNGSRARWGARNTVRRYLVPQAGAEEASAGKDAAARKERMKQGTPRVDFRRVAQQDVRLRGVRLREVWRQAPGVGVHDGSMRGADDSEAPGPAHGRCEAGPGARAPQAAWC